MSNYRLGIVNPLDKWSNLISRLRNNKKWLRSPDRLKISDYLDFSAHNSILEIGPQTGWRTMVPLVNCHQSVTALDLWNYYPAWKSYRRRINFVLGDASRGLPFADESYDACIFLGAICYLANPFDCLVEVNRILKPSGHLFLSCNSRRGYCAQNNLLDPAMKTLWDVDEMRTHLVTSGFTPKEIYYWGYPDLTRYEKFLTELEKFCTLSFFQKRQKVRYSGQEGFVCSISQKKQ